MPHLTQDPQDRWNEWFAGVTDGDGCFVISEKQNHISYELTTHITDIRLLYNIKNTLKTGSVKPRSRSQSARFRVKQKSVILEILKRLDGKLYHPKRLEQYHRACLMLNFQPNEAPNGLNKTNGYLSGLIDSDGSLAISVSRSSSEDSQKSKVEGRIVRLINSKGFNQMTLKVTSIYKEPLVQLQESYRLGVIWTEKANKQNRFPNTKYHWTIRSYEDFQKLYDYLKLHPLKSVKMHRVRLSLLYFQYKQLKYHLKPKDSLEFQIWVKFCRSWFKYSF